MSMNMTEPGSNVIGTVVYGGETLTLRKGMYFPSQHFKLAIFIDCEDGEPYCTLSTNPGFGVGMQRDEFVINHNAAAVQALDEPPFLEVVFATGLFEDTGRKMDYGMVKQMPVWRLKQP